jgi:hypothetical protein
VLVAAGQAQVVDGGLVHREEAAGGAVFGGHVADRRAVGQRQIGQARTVELHELADHALLAEHLGDGQHQVGGGDAFAHLADQLEADDVGISMAMGWPSIAASASIPPTPQPSTPRPFTIVVWLSVP